MERIRRWKHLPPGDSAIIAPGVPAKPISYQNCRLPHIGNFPIPRSRRTRHRYRRRPAGSPHGPPPSPEGCAGWVDMKKIFQKCMNRDADQIITSSISPPFSMPRSTPVQPMGAPRLQPATASGASGLLMFRRGHLADPGRPGKRSPLPRCPTTITYPRPRRAEQWMASNLIS
ncbi:MAG: hypothetical protein JWQ98_3661 [Chlorobi bacterium]|nr:hypothetical protein [Chlorobiota bacterium]